MDWLCRCIFSSFNCYHKKSVKAGQNQLHLFTQESTYNVRNAESCDYHINVLLNLVDICVIFH